MVEETLSTIKWTTFCIIVIVYIRGFSVDQTFTKGPVSSASRLADSRAGYYDYAKNDTNTISYITTDGENISLPLAKSLLNKPPPVYDVDIFRLNMATSPNTIVSAYFRFASKHGASQYDDWMKTFLSLQDSMVIFTDGETFEQIKKFRSHALNRTVIIQMNIEDTPFARLYANEFWEDQLQRDPEAATHKSYELFWIWLGKCWFVSEAIRLNFFQSDLFLWSDIGAFREGTYASQTLILHRELVPPHEMMQMAHATPNPPKEDLFVDKIGHYANFYHSGMHFVAYKNTWLKFYEYFLDTIDRFLEHDLIIVDDQAVLQSVCLSYPEICAYVLFSEVNDKRYRGLRYVLHHGGHYNLWRYNKTITN